MRKIKHGPVLSVIIDKQYYLAGPCGSVWSDEAVCQKNKPKQCTGIE